jgi:hypothetical protein
MNGLVGSEYYSSIARKQASVSLTCMGSGFGNANMIRPNGDFSSLGLAELFNVSLVGMASNTSSVQNFARSFSIPMASVLSMALALIAFI